MKTIYANQDGAIQCAPKHVCPDHDADFDIVSDETRDHERETADGHNIGRSWVKAVSTVIDVATHDATPAYWRNEHWDAVY